MSSGVKRWVIVNPYDTNPATNHWTFPQNPASMTSPFPEKAVTSMGNPRGQILMFEGAPQARQWQFSGPILHKQHLDDLSYWVYTVKNRLRLEDHFGRYIGVYFTGLDVVPKRRLGYYYSHDYTVTGLIYSLKYGNGEVDDDTKLGWYQQ